MTKSYRDSKFDSKDLEVLKNLPNLAEKINQNLQTVDNIISTQRELNSSLGSVNSSSNALRALAHSKGKNRKLNLDECIDIKNIVKQSVDGLNNIFEKNSEVQNTLKNTFASSSTSSIGGLKENNNSNSNHNNNNIFTYSYSSSNNNHQSMINNNINYVQNNFSGKNNFKGKGISNTNSTKFEPIEEENNLAGNNEFSSNLNENNKSNISKENLNLSSDKNTFSKLKNNKLKLTKDKKDTAFNVLNANSLSTRNTTSQSNQVNYSNKATSNNKKEETGMNSLYPEKNLKSNVEEKSQNLHLYNKAKSISASVQNTSNGVANYSVTSSFIQKKVNNTNGNFQSQLGSYKNSNPKKGMNNVSTNSFQLQNSSINSNLMTVSVEGGVTASNFSNVINSNRINTKHLKANKERNSEAAQTTTNGNKNFTKPKPSLSLHSNGTSNSNNTYNNVNLPNHLVITTSTNISKLKSKSRIKNLNKRYTNISDEKTMSEFSINEHDQDPYNYHEQEHLLENETNNFPSIDNKNQNNKDILMINLDASSSKNDFNINNFNINNINSINNRIINQIISNNISDKTDIIDKINTSNNTNIQANANSNGNNILASISLNASGFPNTTQSKKHPRDSKSPNMRNYKAKKTINSVSFKNSNGININTQHNNEFNLLLDKVTNNSNKTQKIKENHSNYTSAAETLEKKLSKAKQPGKNILISGNHSNSLVANALISKTPSNAKTKKLSSSNKNNYSVIMNCETIKNNNTITINNYIGSRSNGNVNQLTMSYEKSDNNNKNIINTNDQLLQSSKSMLKTQISNNELISDIRQATLLVNEDKNPAVSKSMNKFSNNQNSHNLRSIDFEHEKDKLDKIHNELLNNQKFSIPNNIVNTYNTEEKLDLNLNLNSVSVYLANNNTNNTNHNFMNNVQTSTNKFQSNFEIGGDENCGRKDITGKINNFLEMMYIFIEYNKFFSYENSQKKECEKIGKKLALVLPNKPDSKDFIEFKASKLDNPEDNYNYDCDVNFNNFSKADKIINNVRINNDDEGFNFAGKLNNLANSLNEKYFSLDTKAHSKANNNLLNGLQKSISLVPSDCNRLNSLSNVVFPQQDKNHGFVTNFPSNTNDNEMTNNSLIKHQNFNYNNSLAKARLEKELLKTSKNFDNYNIMQNNNINNNSTNLYIKSQTFRNSKSEFSVPHQNHNLSSSLVEDIPLENPFKGVSTKLKTNKTIGNEISNNFNSKLNKAHQIEHFNNLIKTKINLSKILKIQKYWRRWKVMKIIKLNKFSTSTDKLREKLFKKFSSHDHINNIFNMLDEALNIYSSFRISDEKNYESIKDFVNISEENRFLSNSNMDKYHKEIIENYLSDTNKLK